MTILIFLAILTLAAMVLPFKIIGLLIGLLAIQAILIMMAAHFVMGGVPFLQAFNAAILSFVFTLIAMVAAVQMLSTGTNYFVAVILGFFAIWLASGMACAIALKTTFSASASIAMLNAIIGYSCNQVHKLWCACCCSVLNARECFNERE